MKIVVSLVIVAMLGIVPVRSKAIVASVPTSGPAALFVIGGVLALGGLGTMWAAPDSEEEEEESWLTYVGLTALVVGIILLDEPGGAQFSPISLDQGAVLGITADEVKIYNQNVALLNGHAENIQQELAQQDYTNDTPDLSQAIKAKWEERQPAINPTAMSVAQKVASQLQVL